MVLSASLRYSVSVSLLRIVFGKPQIKIRPPACLLIQYTSFNDHLEREHSCQHAANYGVQACGLHPRTDELACHQLLRHASIPTLTVANSERTEERPKHVQSAVANAEISENVDLSTSCCKECLNTSKEAQDKRHDEEKKNN